MRLEILIRPTSRWLALGLIGTALSVACGSNTNSTTSGSTTETFTGTVDAGSNWFQTVEVVGNGEMDVQLVTLSPQTTITVGLGIGQVVSGQCALVSYVDDARASSIVSALVAPGAYCVTVVDVGNIQGSDVATVLVAHP